MGTDGCDCRHVVEVQRILPLNVHPDPGDERKSVAEPRIDGVLEMGVSVHEPGNDHAPLVVITLPEVVDPTDRLDRAVVGDRNRTPLDRQALDGNDPVRRDDSHGVSSSRPSGSSEAPGFVGAEIELIGPRHCRTPL